MRAAYRPLSLLFDLSSNCAGPLTPSDKNLQHWQDADSGTVLYYMRS